TPTAVGGAGFTGCDALDQAGLNRIGGLAAIVPPLTVPATTVSHALGLTCGALSGNVWGDGNILLGGGGGDTIEGRGGNDVIDGDRALHVRISYRSDPANPATEIGSTDLMEHPAVTGSWRPGTTVMNLSDAVFKGL